MKIEPKPNCPLNGFEPCKQLDCAWFMKIQGKHPNSGQDVDEWGCSMAWLPVLMINMAKEQHGTGAAVESFRNEMVKANEMSQQVLIATATQNNPDLKVIEVK